MLNSSVIFKNLFLSLMFMKTFSKSIFPLYSVSNGFLSCPCQWHCPIQALTIYNSALIMPSQPNLNSKWLHIAQKVLLIFNLHYLILTFLYCLLFSLGLHTQRTVYLTQSSWPLFHVLVSLLMLSSLSQMPSSHFYHLKAYTLQLKRCLFLEAASDVWKESITPECS